MAAASLTGLAKIGGTAVAKVCEPNILRIVPPIPEDLRRPGHSRIVSLVILKCEAPRSNTSIEHALGGVSLDRKIKASVQHFSSIPMWMYWPGALHGDATHQWLRARLIEVLQ